MPSLNLLTNRTDGDKVFADEIDNEFLQLINAVNQLPDKDGTIQGNLNADLLDGFHVSITGGTDTIPVCNGDLQVELNADLLDGLNASDISAAAFDADTRMLFYQASPPGGWDLVAPPADHILAFKTGAEGGTVQANSWNISGLSVTINGHALSISEIPVHTHSNNHDHTNTSISDHTHPASDAGGVTIEFIASITSNAGTFGLVTEAGDDYVALPTTGSDGAQSVDIPSFSGNTGSAGSGGSHTHTGSVNSNGTWRPPRAYIIIGAKQ